MSGHSREDYDRSIATARHLRNLAIKCGAILFAGLIVPMAVIALAAVGCMVFAIFLHGIAILLNKAMPAVKKQEPKTDEAARAAAWVRISAADEEAVARRAEIRRIMLARTRAIPDEEIKRQRRERIQYGLKRANGREINRGPIIDITPEKT